MARGPTQGESDTPSATPVDDAVGKPVVAVGAVSGVTGGADDHERSGALVPLQAATPSAATDSPRTRRTGAMVYSMAPVVIRLAPGTDHPESHVEALSD